MSLEGSKNGKRRIGIQGFFVAGLGLFAAFIPILRLVFAVRPFKTLFLILGLGLGLVLGLGFRPVAEGARIPWPPDLNFNFFEGGFSGRRNNFFNGGYGLSFR